MTDPVSFADLGLSPEILQAVAESGYLNPTPIQAQAIPHVLMGRDVLGCAQTGTGKTASFTLPMIEILANGRAKARMPRSLILTPTRELAAQISENFDKYGKHGTLTQALLVGGVSMDEQVKKLDRGVDVLIATPGRLMDLFDRGKILMNDIKVLVIDECDRMLDMGFIPDVERIVAMLPKLRQTLMFSATLAPEIRRLADVFLMNPREVSVAPPATTAVTVTQFLAVVNEDDKREALRLLLKGEEVKNAFIFCNRKRDVDILYKSLKQHGFNVGALHGDMVQSVRTDTLDGFKNDRISLLVCSDVAARGLDIQGMSHVFNFDVPFNAEDYVHRIGRTGRAGNTGRAFTLAGPGDGKLIEAIEALTNQKLDQIDIIGVESVDFEDPADRKSRGRGRGGKPDGEMKAEGENAGGRGRGRGRGGRDDRKPREERPARSEQPVPVSEPGAEQPVIEDMPVREARPPRDGRGRDDRHGNRQERQSSERQSGDRQSADRQSVDRQGNDRQGRAPREDRAPRDERGRPERSRDDRGPREDRAPRDERGRPDRQERGDRYERGGRYRRDDDLGPSVLGFGDEMPNFVKVHVERLARGEKLEAGSHNGKPRRAKPQQQSQSQRRHAHKDKVQAVEADSDSAVMLDAVAAEDLTPVESVNAEMVDTTIVTASDAVVEADAPVHEGAASADPEAADSAEPAKKPKATRTRRPRKRTTTAKGKAKAEGDEAESDGAAASDDSVPDTEAA